MQRFIEPKTLARIKDLRLIARTVADGFLHGLQQSHQRGVGIEFSQYRQYEPGDPLSRIDWKLFARSDRYFVREAERESEISIWFVLDASASMQVASENGAWDKFEYARHLLATLAYIGQKQGDHIGLLALSSNRQVMLPPASGERHWHRLLKQLAQLECSDSFPDPRLLKSAINRLQRNSLVFIISDFYQLSNELHEFMKQVSAGRTEVIALQLQSDDETQFPYRGAVRFEDFETREQVLVSASSARQTWLSAINAHKTQLEAFLRRHRIALNSINIDQPMDQALYDFLISRQKVRH